MPGSGSTVPHLPFAHVNNFDFLRLLFATFVIITHSYVLTGLPEHDFLFKITGGQASFSYIGVCGFFVISGYLITKSMLRSHSLGDYYFKRLIRLFPGLWVVLGFTVVVCYFISDKSLGAYLAHYSTRDYLILNAMLQTQHVIDGVFETGVPTKAVNSSLWSIPYEFFCYVFLSALFFFRRNVTVMRLALVSVFVGGWMLQSFFEAQVKEMPQMPFFGLKLGLLLPNLLMFVGGGLWALLPSPSTRSKRLIALVAFVAIVCTMMVDGLFLYNKYLLLPLFLIPFGELNFPWLSWIRKYGDFSYGIYLWGYFIQQLLILFLNLNHIQLMFLATPLAYLAGALSWHLVEKNALRLKGIRLAFRRREAVSLS